MKALLWSRIFFGVALVTTLVLLALYSRCLYATLVPITCSTVAVIWQLGLLHTLGFGLDPYSMLVPFLVFAIGISHGVQIINNIAVRFFFGAGSLLVREARISSSLYSGACCAGERRHRFSYADGH